MKPLEGVRVADFSHVIAGPLATQFLCMLGAEVIKIEPPAGDVLRNYTQRPEMRGMAEPFISTNAGKKSVVLDLKSPQGQADARAIIASCDMMVENFRPGVVDRLGLDAATLMKDQPSLIYCSVSGFGQSGPMRDFPAIDQIIQSVSGLMSLTGYPGEGGPLRVGFPLVDTYAALLTAFALQAAYIQRERDPDRKGQVIDLAMLDASLVMMSSVVSPFLISGVEPVRTGNRGFSLAPTADTFACKAGEITIGAVQQNQWERLCGAMGRGDLANDARFVTPDARIANDTALQAELSATFATRTAEEWEEALTRAGVPAGAIRSLPDAMALLQLEGRNLVHEVATPNGPARVLGAGFLFAHDGPAPSGAAPALGEHTDEVLATLRQRKIA